MSVVSSSSAVNEAKEGSKPAVSSSEDKKEGYPLRVGVDFRKLERSSLIQILKHYQVLRDDLLEATKDDLAILAAKMFSATPVVVDEVVDNFSKRFCHSSAESSQARKRARAAREQLETPARVGEQVAAKFTRSNESGSWVLGNIVEYDQNNEVYAVQDEDDVQKIMSLDKHDVKRLDESCSHLKRGDAVLAVYPETTSFYRATVAKRGTMEIIVRFEDDEDGNGVLHPKRVPARFVLSADVFDDDDYDYED